MAFEDMNEYEKSAWQQSIKILYSSPRRKLLPASMTDRAVSVTRAAAHRIKAVPGAESAQEIVDKVFDGTLALIFQPALRSASPKAAVKRYAKAHAEITTFDQIKDLPLKDRDSMLPPKFGYTLGSAGQGALTAVAVTGAEVSSTVSGGTTAVVAIGAVAADSVASLAIMGRTIGAVAARYGYDVRLPDEELFAMGVLSLGVASSVGAKTQALGALSRLTQLMMRQATWRQLNEKLLVRAIAQVYQLLGLRLTQKKLAQTVPFVGIALNATLSAELTDRTFRRAQAVYRLRSLSEAYDIDPSEWMAAPPPTEVNLDVPLAEPVVDVYEIFEEERRQGTEA